MDTLESTKVFYGQEEGEGDWEEDLRYHQQKVKECEGLIKLLQRSITLQEKMIAVDQLINTIHRSGEWGEYLIIDFYESFLDELGNLKVSRLNMRK